MVWSSLTKGLSTLSFLHHHNPSSGLEMLSLISIFENKVFKMNASIDTWYINTEVPKILIQYRTQHCTHHTSCPTREKSSHSPCDEIRRGACTNTLAILHKYIGHLAEIQWPPALTGYTAEKAPKYSWKMHQEEEKPRRGLKKKFKGWNYFLKWWMC